MIQRGRIAIFFVSVAAIFVSLRLYLDHSWDVFSRVQPTPITAPGSESGANGQRPPPPISHVGPKHPIDDLIADARLNFSLLLGKQSVNVAQAASRYRERRGRHPPPGFDAWFAEAQKLNAVVVEEFFDRIYHDLSPLWGLNPREMRVKTRNQPYVIRVRGGKVEVVKERDTPFERAAQWGRLVEEMSAHLPDLDMAINHMDESRILTPWEKIDEYVAQERLQRKFLPPAEALAVYSGVGDADVDGEPYNPGWIRDQQRKYWDHVKAACPPSSPSSNTTALESWDEPLEYPKAPMAAYTYKGYIRNFTAAKDPCEQPHLRGMHGTFIESISMATTHELLPMFGESKLPQNNEILIPGAVHLSDSKGTFTINGGQPAWADKKDAMVWRGVASGARNKPEQWFRTQRNRFAQMTNGTTVAAAEAGDDAQAASFRLLPADTYGVAAQKEGRLGAWVETFTNVGITNLLCEPFELFDDGKRKPICGWLEPYFTLASQVPLKEQWDYKYLPDIDGNSFSGRYRAFILSTSLPLKSSIYLEWLDDRLFPWVHFVPVDNSMMDLYGIMDYFLGGHDHEAEAIAAEGKRWGELVLRREDMRLYVWRLLLEYARVVDDQRDRLAFVNDLK